MDFQYSEEQKKLKNRVREFAEEKLQPIAAEADQLDDISWEVVNLLANEGLFRYLIPEEYGGFGIKPINLSIIREELSRVCIQADDTFAMNGLGGYPIVRFGNEQQKQKYLPAIARGEKIGSYALTEPSSGSDVAAIKMTATLDGDSYILNGEKSFASNAEGAEVCSLYAKTDPSLRGKGISAFIVDVKNRRPGLECQGMKLMAPHPAYQLKFENYRIPKENLLGQRGEGMRIALTTLDLLRTTVGAAAIGMAQAAYEEALAYAQQRFAFGKPIIENQAIQLKLAEMVTNIQAARLLVSQAAAMTQLGKEIEIIGRASMAKLFATEMANHVVDEAMQILGGIGLIRGSRVERIFRAVRAPRIYEGTSEIQKLTIARSILKGEIGKGF